MFRQQTERGESQGTAYCCFLLLFLLNSVFSLCRALGLLDRFVTFLVTTITSPHLLAARTAICRKQSARMLPYLSAAPSTYLNPSYVERLWSIDPLG